MDDYIDFLGQIENTDFKYVINSFYRWFGSTDRRDGEIAWGTESRVFLRQERPARYQDDWDTAVGFWREGRQIQVFHPVESKILYPSSPISDERILQLRGLIATLINTNVPDIIEVVRSMRL